MAKTKKKISLEKFIEKNTCPKMDSIIALVKYFTTQVKVKCFKEKCRWYNKKNKKCLIDALVFKLFKK